MVTGGVQLRSSERLPRTTDGAAGAAGAASGCSAADQFDHAFLQFDEERFVVHDKAAEGGEFVHLHLRERVASHDLPDTIQHVIVEDTIEFNRFARGIRPKDRERTFELAGDTVIEGRVRCLDGREFDFTRPKPHLKFELRLCQPAVC